MAYSFTSTSLTTTSTSSPSRHFVTSPEKSSLFRSPAISRFFHSRTDTIELTGSSQSCGPSPPGVRSTSASRSGTITARTSGARSVIQPLPLSSKELYRLKASWNSGLETHNSFKEAGLDTIVGLFKQRPDLLAFFERITKNLPEEHKGVQPKEQALRTNLLLQTHASRVLKTFDRMITFIDDPAQLERVTESAAHDHFKSRCLGFTSDKFQAIVIPLMDALRCHLGPRFNAELESIYSRAFAYLVSELGRAFDREGTAAAQQKLVAPHDGETRDAPSSPHRAKHESESQCPVQKQNCTPETGTGFLQRANTTPLNKGQANVKEDAVHPSEYPGIKERDRCGCDCGFSGSSPEVCRQGSTGDKGGSRSLHSAIDG